MAIESAADRAVFFDTDDFGVAATLTPQLGDAATINGIFDNAYLLVETGESAMATTSPAFTCRTSDLEAVAAGNVRSGDELTVSSVVYRVTDIQADGTGITMLILEKA